MAILTSDKGYFGANNITTDKKDHFIMIKESIQLIDLNGATHCARGGQGSMPLRHQVAPSLHAQYNPVKAPEGHFVDNDKLVLQCIRKVITRIAKQF